MDPLTARQTQGIFENLPVLGKWHCEDTLVCPADVFVSRHCKEGTGRFCSLGILNAYPMMSMLRKKCDGARYGLIHFHTPRAAA